MDETTDKSKLLRKISQARLLAQGEDWKEDAEVKSGSKILFPYRTEGMIKSKLNKILIETGLEYSISVKDCETLAGLPGFTNRVRAIMTMTIYDIDTGASIDYSTVVEGGDCSTKASMFMTTNGYKSLVSTIFGINSQSDDEQNTAKGNFPNEVAKAEARKVMAGNVISKMETPAPKLTVSKPVGVPVTAQEPTNDTKVKESTVLASKPVVTPIATAQRTYMDNVYTVVKSKLTGAELKEAEDSYNHAVEVNDRAVANEWIMKYRSI